MNEIYSINSTIPLGRPQEIAQQVRSQTSSVYEIKLLEPYASLYIKCEPVGSRVTCNPPPTDTDSDFLILVSEENWLPLIYTLELLGMTLDGSRPDDPINDNETYFQSYSVGNVNLILTKSNVFYDRFMAATSVAKRLNLLNKSDRVALFQAVLYGNYPPVLPPLT